MRNTKLHKSEFGIFLAKTNTPCTVYFPACVYNLTITVSRCSPRPGQRKVVFVGNEADIKENQASISGYRFILQIMMQFCVIYFLDFQTKGARVFIVIYINLPCYRFVQVILNKKHNTNPNKAPEMISLRKQTFTLSCFNIYKSSGPP